MGQFVTRPQCRNCGSFRILWDAWVEWDIVALKYVISSVFDHCECGDCGSEDLKEVEVDFRATNND